MLQKRSTYGLLLMLLCSFFQSSGQSEEIVQDIEKEYQLALERMAAYQYEKALYHIYNCQRMKPKNVDYNAKLGFCYFKLGNYSDAKLCYQSILKLDSINVNALSNLALIYDREANYQAAHRFYEQLLQIDSTNSYYYKQVAYVAVKRREVLEALSFFTKAHELNPKDITVVREMADLYLSLEALDYAGQMVDKGFQLDSMNIKMLYSRAKVANKRKAYLDVVNSVEKVLVQKDTAAYYETMLGVAYLQLDSLDKAQFHFERLIDQKKTSEHIHHYLALIFDKKGDQEKSIEHLEQAIEEAVSPKLSIYFRDLASNPSEHQEYTTERIAQLKRLIHFQKGQK